VTGLEPATTGVTTQKDVNRREYVIYNLLFSFKTDKMEEDMELKGKK